MLISSTILLGISVAILIFFNGMLSKYAGEGNSVVLIHLIGGMIILGIYLIFKRKKINIKSVPKLFLTSGSLGVLIVLLNNMIIKEIGTSILLVLVIAGQLIFSVLVDSFGAFGRQVYKLNNKKAVSLVFVAIGVMLIYLN